MKSRILHVIDHTDPGGAQVVVEYLIRVLREDFVFAVAVLGKSGIYTKLYRELGIAVYVMDNRFGKWDPLPVGQLARLVRQERFDLLHAHLFKSGISSAICARTAGLKSIMHDHTGIYPKSLNQLLSNRLAREGYLLAYRFALLQTDLAIVLTPADRDQYLQYFKLSPKKVHILPNGVDFQRFNCIERQHPAQDIRLQLGLSNDTKLVMMVGRLSPEKDWPAFLRVAEHAELRLSRPCAFLVVGSGDQEQMLRSMVDSRKLSNVFFLGHRLDIPELLAQSDIFILTSRREPFGIALLEAMAAGCPVIATRSGGPESIITDEVNGLLVDVGDSNGIAQWIARLLDQEPLRQRLANEGKRTVMQYYDTTTITDQMHYLYDRSLRR